MIESHENGFLREDDLFTSAPNKYLFRPVVLLNSSSASLSSVSMKIYETKIRDINDQNALQMLDNLKAVTGLEWRFLADQALVSVLHLYHNTDGTGFKTFKKDAVRDHDLHGEFIILRKVRESGEFLISFCHELMPYGLHIEKSLDHTLVTVLGRVLAPIKKPSRTGSNRPRRSR